MPYPWLHPKQLVAKVINQCPNLFVLLSLILDKKIAITFFAHSLRLGCPMANGVFVPTSAHIHSSPLPLRNNMISVQRETPIYIIGGVCSVLRHSFGAIFPLMIFLVSQRRRMDIEYTRCERPFTYLIVRLQTVHTFTRD